jgi:cell division protein FtsA
MDMTVRAAHLDVESLVVGPVATGLACLTAEERELGVALVEFGAAVTNVSVFIGGMLVGLETIQKGASDITDDIASAFGIRRAQAELLKCFHGSALTSPRDHQEVLDIGPDENGVEAGANAPRITKAQLNAVVCQRVDSIVTEIAQALKTLGFSGPSGHQVVLTGGGAELKGAAEHMQGALGRTVRIGRPSGLASIPEAHAGPAFSTLVGLIHYAASERVDLKSGYDLRVEQMAGTMPGLIERIKRAVRENF